MAYPEGNQALARWAIKVALALSSEWNWPSLQARRTQFFNEREPPDRARVWLGCMEWTPIGFAYLSGALGEPTDPDGYSITFRVLHMVVQVVIPAAPEGGRVAEGRLRLLVLAAGVAAGKHTAPFPSSEVDVDP